MHPPKARNLHPLNEKYGFELLNFNQIIFPAPHLERFHVFKLMPPQTAVDALHDVLIILCGQTVDEVDARLVY